MDRRDFVRVAGATSAALALAPADLLFPGSDAVARVTPRQARAALDRLRGEAPCHAELRTERGGPRLFVNGTETLPVWGLSTSLLETVGNYTAMGMPMLQPQMGMASAWTGPGQYDFTRLETYLGQILALAPDTYFFPRVQLLTPPWWKEAHPDETMRFGADVPARNWDGWRTRPTDSPLREGDHHFTNFYGEAWEASYASEAWRRDTGEMLQALVRFIEQSPLVSRMMGYFFVHGNTEEWNVGGDNWWPGYEAPMQREAGPVPTPAERLDASFGLLRDPDKEAGVIHFYRRFHEVRAETIAHLARALKEAMTTPVITGTFFGYLMETPRIQESGHLAPRAVLESSHLDIVACPYTYVATNDPAKARWESDLYDGAENWVGRSRGVGGDASFRSMVESYRRRNKLYVSEMDPSTYLDAESKWRIIGGSGHDTQAGTLQILRRDLGNVVAAGVGGWLYDFGPVHGVPGGWYGSPEIIEACRPAIRLMQARLTHDIGSVAQIAVAGDCESFFVSRHWQDSRPWDGQGIRYTDFFNHWFLNAQARSVNRIGAPHDLLYRTDLRADDFERYKLVLVPNTFLLRPDEVDALHERLRGSGATVVWMYAPGLLRPDRVDLSQMERLTGFTFEALEAPGALMIDALGPDGQKVPFGIRSPLLYSPRFVVRGDGFETLGVWQGSEAPAFARRAMDGWTSVYVGTAPLPASVLRRLAADAGASLWTDRSAVVTASRAGAMVVGQDGHPALGSSTPVGGASEPLTVTFPFAMADASGGPARTVHTLSLGFGDVRLFTPAGS